MDAERAEPQAVGARERVRQRRGRRGRRNPEAEQPTGRSRRKLVLWAALAVLVVVVLAAVAWFSPLLSVRKVSVVGNGSIPEQDVITALDVPDGRPLLRVNTSAAAQRVSRIPKVAQARVQRKYPSTVQVTITERRPAVFVDSPQGPHLLDADAVDFAIAAPPPPGVPRLRVDSPGPKDPKTQAALAVLAAAPDPLRVQVGEVAAKSVSDVELTLLDGRVVVWGSRDNSERKASITLPLLSQPGHIYDVSSPDLPTVK